MSKAQFIMDFPKERIAELRKYDCEYRILPYPHYAEDMVVLGMEEKDVKDVCAISFADKRPRTSVSLPRFIPVIISITGSVSLKARNFIP